MVKVQKGGELNYLSWKARKYEWVFYKSLITM